MKINPELCVKESERGCSEEERVIKKMIAWTVGESRWLWNPMVALRMETKKQM